MPERTIPGRSTEMVDIGEVIAAGAPDEDGDVIPVDVTFGGYRVRKLGPDEEGALTTEALVLDRRRKTYTTYYNTGCCFLSPPRLNPTTLSGAVGGSGLETLQLKNACTSVWESALNPFYWSDNGGIATIGSSSGSANLVGVGSTLLWGRTRYFKDAPWECTFPLESASSTAQVFSVSVSLSLASVAPGGQTTVTVTVLPALAGKNVSLSRQEVANSGGHFHLGRPLGTLGAQSGITNAQGKFTTTYTASAFGGGEVIKASHTTANNTTVSGFSPTLIVRVLNLLSLSASSNYALIGSNSWHPSNHYGTSGFNSALSSLAADYHNEFPNLDVIGINDMSLVRGGLFDINANWQSDHIEHRLGINADIRANDCDGRRNFIPRDTAVRTEWQRLCGLKGITCELEFAGTCREHYHLTLQ